MRHRHNTANAPEGLNRRLSKAAKSRTDEPLYHSGVSVLPGSVAPCHGFPFTAVRAGEPPFVVCIFRIRFPCSAFQIFRLNRRMEAHNKLDALCEIVPAGDIIQPCDILLVVEVVACYNSICHKRITGESRGG